MSVLNGEVFALAELLPCERCGWMLDDCPCDRPERRSEVFRLAPPGADCPAAPVEQAA